MAEEQKSASQQVMDTIKQFWDAVPRVGDGHAMGMARLGAHELTQALAAFPDSNIRPLEEPGVVGNPTPQIVTQEMTQSEGIDAMLEGYASRVAKGREQDQGMER